MIVLKSILYVEDDVEIQKVAKVSLEGIGGFDLRVFNSGEEALIGAENFSADLILLDLVLPGIDGIETFQKLRGIQAYGTTPCIFMTAKSADAEVEALNNLDVIGVISKPFNPMKLSDEIQELWNQAK